jgi:hypothetical protein
MVVPRHALWLAVISLGVNYFDSSLHVNQQQDGRQGAASLFDATSRGDFDFGVSRLNLHDEVTLKS